MIARIQQLLTHVVFQNYNWEVRRGHGGVFLRAWYMEADVYSHKPEKQYTRKWLLSPHMTDSEIVQTAFKCCLTSMEHRTREDFTYKGKRVFGPHFDIEDLVRLCRKRENAGGRPQKSGSSKSGASRRRSS